MNSPRVVPNPGSDEARAQGCRCPVIDNEHGNPAIGRARGFVIREDCPLHKEAFKEVLDREERHGC